MKTTYETLFEKLTSSINNFIDCSQLKYSLKNFHTIESYLSKTLESSINLDHHISKGLNENIDFNNKEFQNQTSEIKKIEFVFQLFIELKNFLLIFLEHLHIATNFFEEFQENKPVFQRFIEDQLWKKFKDNQSYLFNYMKKIVDKIKLNIENEMKNNNLSIQNFYDLRISQNFKKEEFSHKIDNALKKEKFEINLPDFVKARFFKQNLLLEQWNFSEYFRIYQKSYIEIDEKVQKFIAKSILKCLKEPERFLLRIRKLDLSLLAQIFFLSGPDKMSLQTMEIYRKINQHFYDSYFHKIVEESRFKEIMRFFLDLNIFKNEKKGLIKHLDICGTELRASELPKRMLIKIIVFFVVSCIDEEGRINLYLRNKLKYVFRNLMTRKLSFSTDHIFDLIERILHEISDEKFFILKETKKYRTLMKKAIDIFENQNIFVKNSYLSILRYDMNLADTKMVKFLNKIQLEVTHIKKPNFFKMKHLSTDVVSRVPAICVSGYLSKNTDKIEEWNHLCLRLPKSEVIALLWESGDIESILQNLLNGIGGFGVFFKCSLSIGMILNLCLKSYSIIQNIPFIKEFEEAKSVGAYLAHFLVEKESNIMHGFNLMGFSLGTFVIFNCLLELEKINSKRGKNEQLVLINDVILMGSVVDRDELRKLSLKSIAGNLINCYSERDYVLKYLLKIVKPSVSPIGIQKIGHDDPKVIDIDCTDIINGHLGFRNKMDLVLHRINYNSELY